MGAFKVVADVAAEEFGDLGFGDVDCRSDERGYGKYGLFNIGSIFVRLL